MAYKSILAVLEKDEDAEIVAAVCASIAEGGTGREGEAVDKSRVIGTHLSAMPQLALVASAELPSAAVVGGLKDDHDRRIGILQNGFEKACERAGVAQEWRTQPLSLQTGAGALLDVARCVDLIVLRQPRRSPGEGAWSAIEALVFDSGRPVLFVPYVMRETKPIERVSIAWNGSREAARAVFDALPFIRAAGQVDILTIDPPPGDGQDDRFAGADLAAALARHGARVNAQTEHAAGLPVHSVIENWTFESGADLLVMGAYSHSRLRERFFGGVTRSLFETMPTLTLMSR